MCYYAPTRIWTKIDSFLSLILCYFIVWSARVPRDGVSRARTRMTSQNRKKCDFYQSGSSFAANGAKTMTKMTIFGPKMTSKILNRSQTLKAPTSVKKIWPKPEVLAKNRSKNDRPWGYRGEGGARTIYSLDELWAQKLLYIAKITALKPLNRGFSRAKKKRWKISLPGQGKPHFARGEIYPFWSYPRSREPFKNRFPDFWKNENRVTRNPVRTSKPRKSALCPHLFKKWEVSLIFPKSIDFEDRGETLKIRRYPR